MQYKWAQTPAAVAAQTLAMRERLLYTGGGGGDNNTGAAVSRQEKAVVSIPLNETERFTDVILACLDMLIVSRKRDVSITRVLAFTKRLASLSLALVSILW